MTMTAPITAQPYDPDDEAVVGWKEVVAYLDGADAVYTLSTVRPDGAPHAATILAVWLDGAPYFCTRAASRKGRNLEHDPRCVLSIVDERLDFVLEGEAY
ncbi:MAG: pyridoxamine 5'-phosphate oxidase family protein, partial [Chloroflexota bacterium]